MPPSSPVHALLDRILATSSAYSVLVARCSALLESLAALASRLDDVAHFLPPAEDGKLPVMEEFPDLAERTAAKVLARMDGVLRELRAVVGVGRPANGDASGANASSAEGADDADDAAAETPSRTPDKTKKRGGGPPQSFPAVRAALASHARALARLSSLPGALAPPVPIEPYGMTPTRAAEIAGGLVEACGADLERRANLVRFMDLAAGEGEEGRVGHGLDDVRQAWEQDRLGEVLEMARERVALAKADGEAR